MERARKTRRPRLLLAAPSRAVTRLRIARWLVAILAGTIAAHYLASGTVVFWVADPEVQRVALDHLADLFGKLLPAEIGLVGAATAFYFGQPGAAEPNGGEDGPRRAEDDQKSMRSRSDT